MRKTMAATALSFLLSVGGGVALANSTSGTQGSSAAGTTPPQSSGSHGSDQQGTQANGQGPAGFAEEEVTSAPFTVQSVDKKNRTLVLRAPDGTQSTVNIPSGTPGFDSLNKGEEVQVDYFAAEVFGPGNQQGNRANQNGANQNGSMQGSSSSQANAGTNNHIGKVRNIRKVNNNGNMGNSAHTQDTGAQGSGAGTDPGNH